MAGDIEVPIEILKELHKQIRVVVTKLEDLEPHKPNRFSEFQVLGAGYRQFLKEWDEGLGKRTAALDDLSKNVKTVADWFAKSDLDLASGLKFE